MRRIELEKKLLQDWTWFLAFLESLSEETVNTPVTVSGHDPDVWWTVKDHIAHCFGQIVPCDAAVRDFFATGGSEPFPLLPTGKRLDITKSFEDILKDVDEATHITFEQHRDKSLEELVILGQKLKAQRLELISSLTEEQLATKIPNAPWGDGTIGGWLTFDGDHQKIHIQWAVDGLAAKGAAQGASEERRDQLAV